MPDSVATILDNIDNGRLALPQFQRGYVWSGNQVRQLMESMYRRHPVGSLIVWNTEPDERVIRKGQELAPGTVQLLLDGQQRITSLYGIIRGTPPPFFDGNERAFTGLHFHLDEEAFAFYQPSRMKDDPLWIDVSGLMQHGYDGLDEFAQRTGLPETSGSGKWYGKLSRLLAVRERELHVEQVTGADKTVDVVVDIFNAVNKGGTKLSKGDLALAKICASWPEARNRMRSMVDRWDARGYKFTLDWVLRNVNAIVTGEAEFVHLHDRTIEEIRDGITRAEMCIDHALNLIANRLGLDHEQALFGKYALPIMTHYINRRGGRLTNAVEQDRLLYWYVHSAMWGRFSGSTETVLDQDLGLLEEIDGGIDRLIEQLRLSRGSLGVEPGHFVGSTRGARFYPVLYALTRVGEARDWGTGQVLRHGMLGRMSALEVHHIFPKALLRNQYHYREVNAVANYCFLTKDTNLRIGARSPSEYFLEIEDQHPGALESQWIPMDRELWNVDRYPEFLEVRRRLLAEATNGLLADLRHEPTVPVARGEAAPPSHPRPPLSDEVVDEDEEVALRGLIDWGRARGLPEGHLAYELADPQTGEPLAVLDVAWPDGLQLEYSEPVAVLLDEEPDTLQVANDCGFRHFTGIEAFKRYVESDILVLEEGATAG